MWQVKLCDHLVTHWAYLSGLETGYNKALYKFTFLLFTGNLTFNAAIVNLQVRFEVIVARLGVPEVLVKDSHGTFPAPGTLGVNELQHVRRAADEAEILLHALADTHAPV